MSKILNAAAFATGYVLGARAGRSRYEQIVRTARRVREDAPDLAHQAREQAAHVREGANAGGSGSSDTDDAQASGGTHASRPTGDADQSVASTPMYSAPTPGSGPAPDDSAGVPAPGTSGEGHDEQTPMYSAPSPGAGPAPEGGTDTTPSSGAESSDASRAGTRPVPPEGHTDVEEEVVYSSGPDVETPIEELTEDDPR